jgi:hypothetical protein
VFVAKSVEEQKRKMKQEEARETRDGGEEGGKARGWGRERGWARARFGARPAKRAHRVTFKTADATEVR